MRIEYRSTGRIRPSEENPRSNEKAVDAVVLSIQNYGFKNPIIIDRNGVIVCGHTRWKAAQELGLEKVPVIVADDLTDEQIRAFRIVENKTSEFAGWDYALLENELEEIPSDLSAYGFSLSPTDIDGLFNDFEAPEAEPKTVKCPCCGSRFEP